MMRLRIHPLVALLLLGGCQAPSLPALPTLTPYKIDIQQGNVVTQEMMEKLKPGMTPSQVRFILGTPLVVDAFHKDRWDYVYRFSRRGELQESRRIVIVFKDDKLERIEGDVVPGKAGTTEGGVSIDKPAAAAKPAGAKPAPAKTKPEIASPGSVTTEAVTGSAETPPSGVAETAASGAAETSPSGTAETDATGASDNSKLEQANAQKPKEEKPKEERGFFGRMLDKLGF
jgi:outer membrane protein assembly factor BamE